MTTPDRFIHQLLRRITNMRPHLDRAMTYLGSRDAQTLAELCALPTDGAQLVVWLVLLAYGLVAN